MDLRVYDNCKKVCEGCEHVFNLAADMGGMGFIQSNHSVIMYNNTVRAGAGVAGFGPVTWLRAGRVTRLSRLLESSAAMVGTRKRPDG